MKIYDTSNLDKLTEQEKLWVYNALDVHITLEVCQVIERQFDNNTRATYEFSKSLQAPILEMNMRGVLIDGVKKAELISIYSKEVDRLAAQLDRILAEGLGCGGLNWRSNQQLIALFYGQLNIPPIKKRNSKGEQTPTVNREALEKLRNYHYALPIINHLLRMRDQAKRIGVLKTDIDPDGRIRTSYNIAGTTTGRLSSSFSDFGTGTNLQNIEQRLRRIFISDPGYKFANIDLKSGDSFGLGMILHELFGDSNYLDACESGDIHTSVSRLAWKELEWVGDLRRDKELAENTTAYRDLSVRDMAKKLGHGTNYLGTPFTMARHTHVERSVIEEFQTRRYFPAFPSIQLWHAHVRSQLQSQGHMVTLLGRKRWFFGRRNDDNVVREAVAYEPQSITSDVINGSMLNLWRKNLCQILLQVHDSILVQYREERENEILPAILEAMDYPIHLPSGRIVRIPLDVAIGWNWAKSTDENPDGLKSWKGEDKRKRSPQLSILDQRL